MSVLGLDNVAKRYASRELFRGISFSVEEGEKVGLIGRNGTGKTTIFRMILGEERPDEGALHRKSDLRIGVVEQSPTFAADTSLFDVALSGLDELRALEKEFHEIAEALGTEADESRHDKLLRRMDDVQHRIEFLGGFDYTHRVESVLEGLEFPRERWTEPASRLSGGEKSRLALAKVLVAGFDLLLLDEPTNHVDYRGVEWLESFLHDYPGAVLVISHDRRFLDATVSAILDLDHGRCIRYEGNYSQSREQKEMNDEVLRRAVANQQAFIDKEMDFIRRNMGSQRTAEAKGRLKKLERLDRLEGPKSQKRGPKIRFKGSRGGEVAFETRDLAVRFGERTIFEHLDCMLLRGERIAVIGPNGAGKSTFLRCLVGRLQPTEGFLKIGANAQPGYYDQELTGLEDHKTILSEVHGIRRDLTEEQVRDHLGRFLFSGEDVDKEVRALSGGERARVLLAKLVLSEHTFLILDEPTNHLDLRARESLEQALEGYEGAIVVVSHDRAFLDNVCDRVLEIEDGRVRSFPGSYTEWAARRRREREEALRTEREREQKEKDRLEREAAKEREREERRAAARAQSPDRKATAKEAESEPRRPRNAFKAKQLEEQIAAVETQVAEIVDAMAMEENYRDAEKMRTLQTRHADLTRELAFLLDEWGQYA